jgi:hypothetical protein
MSEKTEPDTFETLLRDLVKRRQVDTPMGQLGLSGRRKRNERHLNANPDPHRRNTPGSNEGRSMCRDGHADSHWWWRCCRDPRWSEPLAGMRRDRWRVTSTSEMMRLARVAPRLPAFDRTLIVAPALKGV